MIGSDIRYAWRSLNHQRFGSLLVIGMLALGIGSTVAVFSLVNGLFLRPFPFPEPERLVYINETAPKWNLEMTGVNYHDYAQWRRDQKVFEAIALYDERAFNLATDEGADRMNGASVTMDFMKVLGRAADHRPHVHAGGGFAEGPAGHADRRSGVARAIRRARGRARQGAQAQ